MGINRKAWEWQVRLKTAVFWRSNLHNIAKTKYIFLQCKLDRYFVIWHGVSTSMNQELRNRWPKGYGSAERGYHTCLYTTNIRNLIMYFFFAKLCSYRCNIMYCNFALYNCYDTR